MGLITLRFPRFLRKFKGFSDSIESIDSMNSIYCEIFYHKSITSQPISYPFYKFNPIEKLACFRYGKGGWVFVE